MASFREDGPEGLDPPWLRDKVGGGILYAMRSVLDALVDKNKQGVRLRFPTHAEESALGYIGNDRLMERGPTQPTESYRSDLRLAFDIWRNAGGPRTILQRLRNFFNPANGPPMRLVSNSATWHEIDPPTGVVTEYVVGSNWNWNNDPSSWWWGWAIIEGDTLWTLDVWGDPGDWGDGGVWGSDMTYNWAVSIRSIIAKWKPANVYVRYPIVTFDPGLFDRTDTAPPNPNGTGEDPSWRAVQNAVFLQPIGT